MHSQATGKKRQHSAEAFSKSEAYDSVIDKGCTDLAFVYVSWHSRLRWPGRAKEVSLTCPRATSTVLPLGPVLIELRRYSVPRSDMDSDAQTTASSATAAWSYDVKSSVYTDLIQACLDSKFPETHQIEFERPIYPSSSVARFSVQVYRRKDEVFQPEEWPVCDLSENLTDEEKASSKIINPSSTRCSSATGSRRRAGIKLAPR